MAINLGAVLLGVVLLLWSYRDWRQALASKPNVDLTPTDPAARKHLHTEDLR